MIKRRTLARLALVCAAGGAATAFGQVFPNRPIRILVPFAAGGYPDILARQIGQHMSRQMGQAVVIDNRPGGNSIIAADAVAKAVPDGYTLLFTTASQTTNPAIYRKLPFDAAKDFAPVSQVALSPALVLVVNPKVPAKNVAEFIVLARTGQLAYGSPGVGNTLHLPGELLNVMAGTKLLHAPYKGAAPALAAVIGGEIQAAFLAPTAAMPVVKAGQVRAIAVTSAARLPSFPDVPSFAESGVPGFDYSGGWQGVFAPARTPPDIVNRLSAEIRRAVMAPDVHAKLIADANIPVGSSPEAFARFVEEDIARFADIVRAAQIPPVE